MSRARRVLGYARVSSAEQALGTSLRDQQEAIRAFAKARGIGDVRFYVEAESAVHEKIERREQIQALLREVRSGDLVVCDKLDRWSRDPEFTHRSVRQIKEAGASFCAVAENLDASTHEGDFMLGIRAVLAKEEHRRIRIRTVGTRALLRDKGYYVEGLAPFGYRRQASKGLERNVLIVVPDEAKIIRRVFRRYLGGASMSQLADKEGWKIDRVKNLLHRRVYVGEIENSRGEWIKGKHEAIIDAELFARAQTTADERRHGGPRPRGARSETSDWILREVARCMHCGAKMGATYAGPKGDGRRYYYHCTKRCLSNGDRSNTGSFVPVRAIEELVGPLVLIRLEELREDIARGAEVSPAAPKADFVERRAKIARRRELVLIEFEDGHIDRDQLRAKIAKLDGDRLKVDAAEAAVVRPSVLERASVRRALLRDLAAVRRAWKQVPPEERREIVNLLASAVKIARGRAPLPVWRSKEDLAADHA